MKYNVLRQLAVSPPTLLATIAAWDMRQSISSWLIPRVLELVYTAHDLTALARDCGYGGTPFTWDEDRRFEIRCELDAAFFHLYLPAGADGDWRPARIVDGNVADETTAQLKALKAHFPTPRDAVAFILDQFPIVRQKDEATFGCHRTKDRIMQIYDAMLAAQQSGKPYTSTLIPAPGSL
jgi:hypothetical protein